MSVRRPIKARNRKWALVIAKWLASSGVRPNHISLLSILFAASSGLCVVLSVQYPPYIATSFLLLAAVFIQLRLLCNLFDGMVAIEGGFKTKSGEIFNDLPDRIADPTILVCTGYALTSLPYGSALGWLAGLLAVFTAYVRLLGGATGSTQYFIGPMAKQHRMALMTASFLIAAATRKWNLHEYVLVVALVAICLGCVVTAIRRTFKIINELESK